MQFIEHIFAPKRLLLAWQAPNDPERTVFVVGEVRERCGVISFRYCFDTEDFRKTVQRGFVCYPAFSKREGDYTDGVMDSFMNRLPPRSRRDFPNFLAQWRLPANVSLSDFALLAYTGAKLPSDGFSLVWPLDEVAAPGEVLLEVAGFRYQSIGLDELSVGLPVRFVPEPENPKDKNALRIEADGRHIGYVKRLQCEAVASWLARYEVHATLERFNGTAERPLVYVFCQLRQRASDAVSRSAAA